MHGDAVGELTSGAQDLVEANTAPFHREDRDRVAPGVDGEEEVVPGVVGEGTLRDETTRRSGGLDTAKAAGRHNLLLGELAAGLLGERYDLVAGWVVSLDKDGRRRRACGAREVGGLGRAGEGRQPAGRGEPDGTCCRRADKARDRFALAHCRITEHGSPSMAACGSLRLVSSKFADSQGIHIVKLARSYARAQRALGGITVDRGQAPRPVRDKHPTAAREGAMASAWLRPGRPRGGGARVRRTRRRCIFLQAGQTLAGLNAVRRAVERGRRLLAVRAHTRRSAPASSRCRRGAHPLRADGPDGQPERADRRRQGGPAHSVPSGRCVIFPGRTRCLPGRRG